MGKTLRMRWRSWFRQRWDRVQVQLLRSTRLWKEEASCSLLRLAQDEFLVLTPAGVAKPAVSALRSTGPACAHAIDVTSGFCGVAIVGPAAQGLMNRITDLDTSASVLPDLTCVQSRFADVQGLLLRRDVNGIAMYQLYAGREFGEYLWGELVETAREVGGGPVGTEALLSLRETDRG